MTRLLSTWTTRGNRVYALSDPRTCAVRYIGKCTGYLNSRVRGHLREAQTTTRQTHKLAWLRSLCAVGLLPTVTVLEEVDDPAALPSAERRWIALYRAQGARLTNATDGGEGMSNPTAEVRAKLRARPQTRFSPQAREAASAFMLVRWQDPAWRAKMVRPPKPKVVRPPRPRVVRPPKPTMSGQALADFKVANAKTMGAGNVGRVRSPETRRQIAESIRRHQAEHGHPRKGMTATEETKERMRAAWVRRKARQAGGATP